MAILILQFSKILGNVKKRKEKGEDLDQQGMTSLACIKSKVRLPVKEKKKKQTKQANEQNPPTQKYWVFGAVVNKDAPRSSFLLH